MTDIFSSLSSEISRRNVVLFPRNRFFDNFDEIVKVLLGINKIDIIGFNNQKRCISIVKEIIVVGFVEAIDIVVVDCRFKRVASGLNPFHQDRSSGLQINSQVRFGDITCQKGSDPIVQGKFTFSQVHLCEDSILGKQVI